MLTSPSGFASGRPGPLSDWIVDRIQQAVISGEIKPGQRLVELQIATQFGVSRGPLREAFRTLERDGLIESRQNRGSYIVSPAPEEIETMVLARALAEGAAGRLVAAKRDPAVTEQLAALLDRQREARNRGDLTDVNHLHWEFHRAICAASGNRHLLDMWRRVSTVLRIYSSALIYRVAVGNNTTFLRYLREEPPTAAEALLRSQILAMSYLSLRRAVPIGIEGYIDRFIDGTGVVHAIGPFEPARLRALLGEASEG
jgi:DNA-binding GntR family transcriptional regulator